MQSYATFFPPSDEAIQPTFLVANVGSTDVSLTTVKVRYWFTFEPSSTPGPEFHCDAALVGQGVILGNLVPVSPARTGADYYVEVGFKFGSLMPGQDTGFVQLRINDLNFGEIHQGDDYSYDPESTTFRDSPKVTAYIDGALVWGEEP